MDIEFAVVAKALENLFEHADCIARQPSPSVKEDGLLAYLSLDLLFQEILYFTS